MKKKDYNKYDFIDIQQDKLHNVKQKMLNKFLIDDILYISKIIMFISVISSMMVHIKYQKKF